MLCRAFSETLPGLFHLPLATVALALAFFGFAPQASAGDVVASELDPACALSPGDPFEGASRFSAGSTRFKGLCVDTGRYRPAANLQQDGGTIRFNNYVMDRKFWSAELAGDFESDDSPVESVYFVIMRFPVVEGVEAAHSQLRFKLRPDRKIRLRAQAGDGLAESDDVMITFEAGLPQGQTYDFALGAFDVYAFVGRVGSTKQKLLERRGRNTLEQYELRLSPRERSSLLLAGLRRSQELAMREFYNTLRPNCTTEVFDLIDALPRVAERVRAGRARPFLTVISTDPIATPSLRALDERGILARRAANFEDEVEGRLQDQPIPPLDDKLPPFFPASDGHAWTVVIAQPPASRFSPSERDALEKVRSSIVASSVRLLQSAGSAFLLAREGAYADVLATTLARLPSEIASEIRRREGDLPRTAHRLAVYFVPVRREAGSLNLSRFGVPAALPIATRAIDWDLETREGQEAAAELVSGTRLAALAAAQSGTPAYLLGTAIVVDVARGGSQVTTQARLGLAPSERPFASENEQVKIETLRVGDRAAPVSERPTLLITHRQATSADGTTPIVHFEFGPDGGLAGRGDREGEMQTLRGSDCETEAAGAAHLIGVFGPRATGTAAIDSFLEGRPVAFRVLGFDLDLREMHARQMQVRVKAWPFSCLEDGEVQRSFEQKANEALETWKAKAQSPEFIGGLLELAHHSVER